MSNTIKFNKTLLASIVATSMLTACGGDDVKVQDTVTEVVEVPVNVPVATPADPVEVTASAHGSIVDGSSMAPLVGAMVDIHVAGQVFAATVTGSSFTATGLPTNSDFIAVVSAAGKATAYTMGTTSDGAINVDTVELFSAVTSSVTVTDMMGDNVSGLSLYIAAAGNTGSMSSGQANEAGEYMSSIPNNFATETDGVYTFTLPANGMSYDVEVAGDFSDLAVVGGTLAVTSGQNPTVYVDDADEATTFSVSFGLTFADGSSVTTGPATLTLNDGAVSASWDAESATYVIDGLSFADVMSPLALDMVNIDGVMFAATDVAAAGLDSFSNATASSSIELAGADALAIDYVVASSKAVSGTSATMTVVFNQPVELASVITSSSTVTKQTTTFNTGSNPFYYVDADGNVCSENCPTASVAGQTAIGVAREHIGALDADGNAVKTAYVYYKDDTDTLVKSHAEDDSVLYVLNGSVKTRPYDFGWITPMWDDNVTTALVDAPTVEEGAEYSWNTEKTVLTIALNNEMHDKNEGIYPAGYDEANPLPSKYFNATDLEDGDVWNVSFVAKAVSGNAVATDFVEQVTVSKPFVATTFESLIVATGDSVDYSQTAITAQGYEHIGYAGQHKWFDSQANNFKLEGATAVVSMSQIKKYLESETMTLSVGNPAEVCGEYSTGAQWPAFGFSWLGYCHIETTETIVYAEDATITETGEVCTSANANYNWPPFGQTRGTCEFEAGTSSYDVYARHIDAGNLASAVEEDYEAYTKFSSAPVDHKVKAAYLVSPESLSGNIEIVSVTKSQWAVTTENPLGGISTAEFPVNTMYSINLTESVSYSDAPEEVYYIGNKLDGALVKHSANGTDAAVPGETFGAPVRTGFPASVQGTNYLYKIMPLVWNQGGTQGGLVTHVTVNLNVTTASGKSINVQNVVMPIQ